MQVETDDKEIISRVLQGDSQSFVVLVNRYRSFIFTIAMRYTSTREDAEEIAQDVFVKAYKALADFRNDCKFSTWLYTITTNTCNTFLRKRRIETSALDDEKNSGLMHVQDTVHNDAAQRSRTALIDKAIKLLHADDAAIHGASHDASNHSSSADVLPTADVPTADAERLLRTELCIRWRLRW